MPVGTVREVSRDGEQSAHFEWLIKKWKEEMAQDIWSPRFSFAGTPWNLMVECHPLDLDHSRRVLLRRCVASRGVVRCWLGVGLPDGSEERIGSCTLEPQDDVYPSWTLYYLLQREKRWAPTGTLTILCRMRTGPDTEKEKKLEKEVASYKQELEESKKSYAKLETNVNSVQRKWSDLQKQHLSTTTEFDATKRENELLKQEKKNLVEQLEERRAYLDDTLVLQEHLKKLLLSSDDHDVVLRVKTKEFGAHKSVLRARSPVFEAMFRHGMKESTENAVDIEDCDPDSFGQFLQYIYTGQVDDLSPSNAPGLYFAGDKYGLPGLKRRCVDLLQSSLSAPLVSDVITLAVTHGEEDLLDAAIEYVSVHLEEVMETVEWQRFLLSNPIRANEVCLKAVKRRRT